MNESQTNSGYDDPDAPWNQVTDVSVSEWNRDIIAEFRANGGKVGGPYEGAELLLLSTTGARSGRTHVVPLAPLYRDDTMYVSSFLEDRYPAWYHNARKNPSVTIELGTRTLAATARVLEGDEYDEFHAWVMENAPLLAEFQEKVAQLQIPLMVITPSQN